MLTLDAPGRYVAYLLRCWAEQDDAAAPVAWRFSLEDPHSGHRRGFASLAALTAFLERALADDGLSPTPPDPPPRAPAAAPAARPEHPAPLRRRAGGRSSSDTAPER